MAAESEPPPESEPPGDRPSEPPRGSIPPDDDDGRRRRRVEGLLRDAIRRGLEKGIGTLRGTDNAIRDLVSDVKLPKEVVSYLFSQVDETKNAMVRGVAREVRDFLEATDLARELQQALTSLSFEIKTEIRFIPNDSGVKPHVKARITPKRRKRDESTKTDDEIDDDPE